MVRPKATPRKSLRPTVLYSKFFKPTKIQNKKYKTKKTMEDKKDCCSGFKTALECLKELNVKEKQKIHQKRQELPGLELPPARLSDKTILNNGTYKHGKVPVAKTPKKRGKPYKVMGPKGGFMLPPPMVKPQPLNKRVTTITRKRAELEYVGPLDRTTHQSHKMDK